MRMYAVKNVAVAVRSSQMGMVTTVITERMAAQGPSCNFESSELGNSRAKAGQFDA